MILPIPTPSRRCLAGSRQGCASALAWGVEIGNVRTEGSDQSIGAAFIFIPKNVADTDVNWSLTKPFSRSAVEATIHKYSGAISCQQQNSSSQALRPSALRPVVTHLANKLWAALQWALVPRQLPAAALARVRPSVRAQTCSPAKPTSLNVADQRSVSAAFAAAQLHSAIDRPAVRRAVFLRSAI